MATKKARVLVDMTIGETKLKPNDVIEASAAQIKSFGESVDASAEAVKYCLANGAKVINIGDGEKEPVVEADEDLDQPPAE